jgi:hypothetical protein
MSMHIIGGGTAFFYHLFYTLFAILGDFLQGVFGFICQV